MQGATSEISAQFAPESLDYLMSMIDELGSDKTYNHYPIGWAHAMDTPFQWTKQVASHLGGTPNGLAVSWPKRIKATGELRSQFHHVIDIVPTILEAANIQPPRLLNGIPQKPMEGVSMVYTFDDAYDGGGLGKGGKGTLIIDAKTVGESRIEKTNPLGKFTLDESFDVGQDTGSPVIDEYDAKMPFKFTGTLRKVEIKLGANQLTPNQRGELQRLRRERALARQ
jgi:hypothetical protein